MGSTFCQKGAEDLQCRCLDLGRLLHIVQIKSIFLKKKKKIMRSFNMQSIYWKNYCNVYMCQRLYGINYKKQLTLMSSTYLLIFWASLSKSVFSTSSVLFFASTKLWSLETLRPKVMMPFSPKTWLMYKSEKWINNYERLGDCLGIKIAGESKGDKKKLDR